MNEIINLIQGILRSLGLQKIFVIGYKSPRSKIYKKAHRHGNYAF